MLLRMIFYVANYSSQSQKARPVWVIMQPILCCFWLKAIDIIAAFLLYSLKH
jgi:hypothetical protein